MKYALVTGGTKGIGKAISKSLLERDYFVILNYYNDEKSAQRTFEEFNIKFPERVRLIKEDLSKIERIGDFCRNLSIITPNLDVLILNAGMTDRTQFPDISYESMLSVFNTNLFVPFFLIQGLVKSMNKNSSIINIGSIMGIYPHSLSLPYGVSKASIHALTKNLVKFLRPFSIRINTVAPGFVNTDWHILKSDTLIKGIKDKIALERFCEPEEVAHLVLSIIDNQYLNGEIINLDAGYNFT
jgi:3-oxoacyl-[acyl-carrier protein] reductase